jgi:hypothetical protein
MSEFEMARARSGTAFMDVGAGGIVAAAILALSRETPAGFDGNGRSDFKALNINPAKSPGSNSPPVNTRTRFFDGHICPVFGSLPAL